MNRSVVVGNEKKIIEKRLSNEQSQETYLVNSLQLIRDRIDQNCGGVKTNEPPNKIIDFSKLSGMWKSDWGEVELFFSEAGVSGNWNQGEGAKGQITGGSFDRKTNTLHYTYSQPWNKKTGHADLELSESLYEYTLSGSWSHNDNTGTGKWTMTKNK